MSGPLFGEVRTVLPGVAALAAVGAAFVLVAGLVARLLALRWIDRLDGRFSRTAPRILDPSSACWILQRTTIFVPRLIPWAVCQWPSRLVSGIAAVRVMAMMDLQGRDEIVAVPDEQLSAA